MGAVGVVEAVGEGWGGTASVGLVVGFCFGGVLGVWFAGMGGWGLSSGVLGVALGVGWAVVVRVLRGRRDLGREKREGLRSLGMVGLGDEGWRGGEGRWVVAKIWGLGLLSYLGK